MKRSAKILVTVVIIIVWFIIFAVTTTIRRENGKVTPGWINTILFIAMIAGIRAIWKSKE